jgi:hypothetical protein
MADDKQPAKDEKPASIAPAVQAPPAASAISGIIQILIKGFRDWFKTKKAKAAIVGFFLITVCMAGLFQYQHDSIKAMSLADAIAGGGGGGGGNGKDPFAKFKDATGQAPLTGSSQEKTAGAPQKVPIGDKNVFQVVAVLTWTDEANTARHTNQPDTFDLQVTAPDGRTSKGSASNEIGKEVVIEVVLARNITQEVLSNKALKQKTQDPTWTGDWNITVACTNAGDQTPNYGPGFIPMRTTADTGNGWKLSVNWTFKAEP